MVMDNRKFKSIGIALIILGVVSLLGSIYYYTTITSEIEKLEKYINWLEVEKRSYDETIARISKKNDEIVNERKEKNKRRLEEKYGVSYGEVMRWGWSKEGDLNPKSDLYGAFMTELFTSEMSIEPPYDYNIPYIGDIKRIDQKKNELKALVTKSIMTLIIGCVFFLLLEIAGMILIQKSRPKKLSKVRTIPLENPNKQKARLLALCHPSHFLAGEDEKLSNVAVSIYERLYSINLDNKEEWISLQEEIENNLGISVIDDERRKYIKKITNPSWYTSPEKVRLSSELFKRINDPNLKIRDFLDVSEKAEELLL